MKLEYWVLKFQGISDSEFEKLANLTTLPIRYRRDRKAMLYEWHQYAKTELGICADMMFNSHGKYKWLSRRTQVQFEDGARIVLVRTESVNSNY